ncbi:MAG: cytochrome c3 family protein, partial [Acidobacteriota bacterium]
MIKKRAIAGIPGCGVAPAPGALFLAVAVVTATLAAAPAAAQEPAEHPRLVSVEAARCTACHGDLVEDRSVVHPPAADDCTTCHDFQIDDAGTRVALMDAPPSLCVLCHDEEAEANGEVATPHVPVVDTCLNCHDPHAADRPSLLLDAQPDLCAVCHDVEGLQEVHGGQLTDGVTCTACHEPHGSESPSMLAAAELHPPFEDGTCTACHRPPFGNRIRLQARGEEVCSACHGEMSEPDDASVHAALTGDRRRAGCLSCHDPHMSSEAPLLQQRVPEVCAQCHEPILDAVRADTGHAVGEDCTWCHRPHSSPEPRLLTARPPGLCGDCHDIGGEELTAAHLGADLTGLDCLACHSPHGAGNPSLLAQTLHPPVLDGCDLCHEGASDALMEDGESALCFYCHAD